MVERTFAHAYETGGLRRLYVRGKQNVQKRLLLHEKRQSLFVRADHIQLVRRD
jgi:hypothetical protein